METPKALEKEVSTRWSEGRGLGVPEHRPRPMGLRPVSGEQVHRTDLILGPCSGSFYFGLPTPAAESGEAQGDSHLLD